MRNVFKTILITTIFSSLTTHAGNLSSKDYNFFAPSVYDKSTVTDARIGSVVYDTSDLNFWGKAQDSSWKQLSIAAANLVAVGTIHAFAGTTEPDGYLIADGRAVSRDTYSALFAVIGTSFGSGNGSSTFNLPDLRGRFLRGVDGSAGNDPDAASRTAMATGGNTGNNVGSIQSDETLSHSHSSASVYNSGSSTGYTVGTISSPSATLYLNVNNSGTSTGSSGGSETRPVNAYVNYLIKY